MRTIYGSIVINDKLYRSILIYSSKIRIDTKSNYEILLGVINLDDQLLFKVDVKATNM